MIFFKIKFDRILSGFELFFFEFQFHLNHKLRFLTCFVVHLTICFFTISFIFPKNRRPCTSLMFVLIFLFFSNSLIRFKSLFALLIKILIISTQSSELKLFSFKISVVFFFIFC